jgi:hypothetical protein
MYLNLFECRGFQTIFFLTVHNLRNVGGRGHANSMQLPHEHNQRFFCLWKPVFSTCSEVESPIDSCSRSQYDLLHFIFRHQKVPTKWMSLSPLLYLIAELGNPHCTWERFAKGLFFCCGGKPQYLSARSLASESYSVSAILHRHFPVCCVINFWHATF